MLFMQMRTGSQRVCVSSVATWPALDAAHLDTSQVLTLCEAELAQSARERSLLARTFMKLVASIPGREIQVLCRATRAQSSEEPAPGIHMQETSIQAKAGRKETETETEKRKE